MKAHVLFDDKGRVCAMSHPRPGKKRSHKGQGGFLPGTGERTAFLDVPKELMHLKPRDLHDAIRVAYKNGEPHLVAKTA